MKDMQIIFQPSDADDIRRFLAKVMPDNAVEEKEQDA